ncbi:MAG: hypothetical protein H8E76_10095 [Helicobacteraceae bacterium]|nr:hypothetical protein [Candidatus Sulfurimonas ponti]MBL6973567.1 hypothetical protein [Sulfurimonas sp.]
MIRLLSLLLICNLHLLGGGFWTLTGLTKANIYVANKIAYLNPQTIVKAKETMLEVLEKNAIKTQEQDSPTLMLELEDIENDESHYVYIKLALGEEVQTFRKTKDQTFAITYMGTDFIDVDASDLDAAVLESLNSLLLDFIEQFEDDKN